MQAKKEPEAGSVAEVARSGDCASASRGAVVASDATANIDFTDGISTRSASSSKLAEEQKD